MVEKFYDLRVHSGEIPWKILTPKEIDMILEKRIEAFKARPSPKREGYVIERIAEMSNLWEAHTASQAGGKIKRNKSIKRHNERAEEDLRALQLMILTLELPPNDYRIEQRKSDVGKIRDLVIMEYFPWRIIPHAIMQVIGDRLYKRLIYDSCACIKNKGLHFGVKRMKAFIRRYDVNYFWKADYKKFYQAIPQDLIIGELEKMFKDKRFIQLMTMLLGAYESDIENVLNDEKEKRCANRGI